MDLGYFATVVTQQVSVEQLAGLGLHEGDTLHVLSQLDSAFLVSIVHASKGELLLNPMQQLTLPRRG